VHILTLQLGYSTCVHKAWTISLLRLLSQECCSYSKKAGTVSSPSCQNISLVAYCVLSTQKFGDKGLGQRLKGSNLVKSAPDSGSVPEVARSYLKSGPAFALGVSIGEVDDAVAHLAGLQSWWFSCMRGVNGSAGHIYWWICRSAQLWWSCCDPSWLPYGRILIILLDECREDSLSPFYQFQIFLLDTHCGFHGMRGVHRSCLEIELCATQVR